jgi:hypothetical protein
MKINFWSYCKWYYVMLGPTIKIIQYIKLQVMFKVSPTRQHKFTDKPNCVLKDARLRLMPSVIPNSNYVIMASD